MRTFGAFVAVAGLLMTAVLIVESAPGDPFELCSKSCSKDPSEQTRLNSWIIRDTEADKCTVACAFKAMKLLSETAEINVENLKKLLAAKEPKIDFSALKISNINAPGFMLGFAEFLNTNRAGLAQVLNHSEALLP